MNSTILSPAQVVDAYGDAGKAKCTRSSLSVFLLAVLAGALIAFAAAATNTAAHNAQSVGAGKLICGLLFPFGLAIVILMGAELFTGNCLIVISVLEKKTTLARMIKNWVIVYIGNFIGALAVAAACAYFGQFDLSNGELAIYTMKIASSKCMLSFSKAVIFGIACNVLVCLAVLCAMTAKDTTGKILGALVPVALFVLCGFEHSIANMYYVPAGIFANTVSAYSDLAIKSGLDLINLNWSSFLINNLFPVTLGNIIGGVGISSMLWKCHISK